MLYRDIEDIAPVNEPAFTVKNELTLSIDYGPYFSPMMISMRLLLREIALSADSQPFPSM